MKKTQTKHSNTVILIVILVMSTISTIAIDLHSQTSMIASTPREGQNFVGGEKSVPTNFSENKSIDLLNQKNKKTVFETTGAEETEALVSSEDWFLGESVNETHYTNSYGSWTKQTRSTYQYTSKMNIKVHQIKTEIIEAQENVTFATPGSWSVYSISHTAFTYYDDSTTGNYYVNASYTTSNLVLQFVSNCSNILAIKDVSSEYLTNIDFEDGSYHTDFTSTFTTTQVETDKVFSGYFSLYLATSSAKTLTLNDLDLNYYYFSLALYIETGSITITTDDYTETITSTERWVIEQFYSHTDSVILSSSAFTGYIDNFRIFKTSTTVETTGYNKNEINSRFIYWDGYKNPQAPNKEIALKGYYRTRSYDSANTWATNSFLDTTIVTNTNGIATTVSTEALEQEESVILAYCKESSFSQNIVNDISLFTGSVGGISYTKNNNNEIELVGKITLHSSAYRTIYTFDFSDFYVNEFTVYTIKFKFNNTNPFSFIQHRHAFSGSSPIPYHRSRTGSAELINDTLTTTTSIFGYYPSFHGVNTPTTINYDTFPFAYMQMHQYSSAAYEHTTILTTIQNINILQAQAYIFTPHPVSETDYFESKGDAVDFTEGDDEEWTPRTGSDLSIERGLGVWTCESDVNNRYLELYSEGLNTSSSLQTWTTFKIRYRVSNLSSSDLSYFLFYVNSGSNWYAYVKDDIISDGSYHTVSFSNIFNGVDYKADKFLILFGNSSSSYTQSSSISFQNSIGDQTEIDYIRLVHKDSYLSSSNNPYTMIDNSVVLESDANDLSYLLYNNNHKIGTFSDLSIVPLNSTVGTNNFTLTPFKTNQAYYSQNYTFNYTIEADSFSVNVQSFYLTDSYVNLYVTSNYDGSYTVYEDGVSIGSGNLYKEGTSISTSRDTTSGAEINYTIEFTYGSETVTFTTFYYNEAELFYLTDYRINDTTDIILTWNTSKSTSDLLTVYHDGILETTDTTSTTTIARSAIAGVHILTFIFSETSGDYENIVFSYSYTIDSFDIRITSYVPEDNYIYTSFESNENGTYYVYEDNEHLTNSSFVANTPTVITTARDSFPNKAISYCVKFVGSSSSTIWFNTSYFNPSKDEWGIYDVDIEGALLYDYGYGVGYGVSITCAGFNTTLHDDYFLYEKGSLIDFEDTIHSDLISWNPSYTTTHYGPAANNSWNGYTNTTIPASDYNFRIPAFTLLNITDLSIDLSYYTSFYINIHNSLPDSDASEFSARDLVWIQTNLGPIGYKNLAWGVSTEGRFATSWIEQINSYYCEIFGGGFTYVLNPEADGIITWLAITVEPDCWTGSVLKPGHLCIKELRFERGQLTVKVDGEYISYIDGFLGNYDNGYPLFKDFMFNNENTEEYVYLMPVDTSTDFDELKDYYDISLIFNFRGQTEIITQRFYKDTFTVELKDQDITNNRVTTSVVYTEQMHDWWADDIEYVYTVYENDMEISNGALEDSGTLYTISTLRDTYTPTVVYSIYFEQKMVSSGTVINTKWMNTTYSNIPDSEHFQVIITEYNPEGVYLSFYAVSNYNYNYTVYDNGTLVGTGNGLIGGTSLSFDRSEIIGLHNFTVVFSNGTDTVQFSTWYSVLRDVNNALYREQNTEQYVISMETNVDNYTLYVYHDDTLYGIYINTTSVYINKSLAVGWHKIHVIFNYFDTMSRNITYGPFLYQTVLFYQASIHITEQMLGAAIPELNIDQIKIFVNGYYVIALNLSGIDLEGNYSYIMNNRLWVRNSERYLNLTFYDLLDRFIATTLLDLRGIDEAVIQLPLFKLTAINFDTTARQIKIRPYDENYDWDTNATDVFRFILEPSQSVTYWMISGLYEVRVYKRVSYVDSTGVTLYYWEHERTDEPARVPMTISVPLDVETIEADSTLETPKSPIIQFFEQYYILILIFIGIVVLFILYLITGNYFYEQAVSQLNQNKKVPVWNKALLENLWPNRSQQLEGYKDRVERENGRNSKKRTSKKRIIWRTDS